MRESESVSGTQCGGVVCERASVSVYESVRVYGVCCVCVW